jgi:hypothetical protein
MEHYVQNCSSNLNGCRVLGCWCFSVFFISMLVLFNFPKHILLFVLCWCIVFVMSFVRQFYFRSLNSA